MLDFMSSGGMIRNTVTAFSKPAGSKLLVFLVLSYIAGVSRKQRCRFVVVKTPS